MKYAIQCDKLRSTPEGQMIWSTIMALAQPISEDDFETNCDGDGFLEDGESYLDFCCSDDDSGFYKSETPDGDVYFLQTGGFEFFFTPKGKPPAFYIPEYQEQTLLILRDGPLATLVLPAGDGRMQGRNGAEFHSDMLSNDLEVIQGRDTRFRLMVDGEAVAGLKIRDSVITDIYVRADMRRQGLASRLIEQVESTYGRLVPDSSQTADGKAFFRSREKKEKHSFDAPSP